MSDSERHEADKAAAEIFDEFAYRLESGEDPVGVLEDALGVMAEEWKQSVDTDCDQEADRSD